MKIINTLKTELNRSIINPLFFVAIFLTCGLFFLSGYEEFFYYAPQSPYMDVFHFFDFLRNVGTFETMLIICCTIPYTISFCTDYNSSYVRLIKSRTGENNYIFSRVIACFISGGLAVALGMLLFISLVALNYPLVDMDGGAYQSVLMRMGNVPEAFDLLLVSGNYILYFICNIVVLFLMCGLWSIVGLLVSAVIPNPFVALFSPYILYFLQSVFVGDLPNHFNTSRMLKSNFNVGMPLANMIYATIFVLGLSVVIGISFGYFCKRRLRDELH